MHVDGLAIHIAVHLAPQDQLRGQYGVLLVLLEAPEHVAKHRIHLLGEGEIHHSLVLQRSREIREAGLFPQLEPGFLVLFALLRVGSIFVFII